MSGVIERRIRERVEAGRRLSTPTQSKPFIVSEFTSEAVILLLAEKWATPISWECLEGLLPFIRERGRVEIAGRFDTSAKQETLDDYLKQFVKRATAGWVAVVLEEAGIVNIDRRRPASVSLTEEFRQ